MSNKPNLVLVHGFLSGKDYWHKQIDLLAQKFNVIALDLKGYGERANELGCDSIGDFAKDIIQQLNDNNIQQFNLLGHSMGGMIAQEIIKTIPSRISALILYGTGAMGNLPDRFEPIDTSIQKAENGQLNTAIENIVASWFYQQRQDENFNSAIELAKKSSLNTYINGLIAMKSWSGQNNLSNINCPTLIIWGDTDRTYKLAQINNMLNNIPNASLTIIPNSAHNVHLENSDIFNQSLLDFLNNLKSSPQSNN